MISSSRDELIRNWMCVPEPLPDGYVAPRFDPQKALREAEEMETVDSKLPRSRRRHPSFRDFAVRPGMTTAEAVFWFRVAIETNFNYLNDVRYEFGVTEAIGRYPEKAPARVEIEDLVVQAVKTAQAAVGVWLLPLIGLRQLVEWCISGRLDELTLRGNNYSGIHFLAFFGHRLAAFVTCSEWQSAVRALDEHLDPADWYAVSDVAWERRRVRTVWNLAVYLGHTEPLRRLVESWPDDMWDSSDWLLDRGLFFVFGVRDPEFSLRHLARLKLKPACSGETAIWLLHTGDRMLGPVIDLARRAGNKDEAEAIVSQLGTVESPRVIRCLLELAESTSGVQRPARDWLAANPDRTLASCAQIVSEDGPRNSRAASHLHRSWAGTHREAVETLSSTHGSPCLSELLNTWKQEKAGMIGPEVWPLRPRMSGVAGKLPEWVQLERLASLRRGSARISAEGVRLLLGAVRNGKDNESFFDWVRDVLTPDSREAFWQSLIVEWCVAGTGKKDNWCMAVAVALRGPSTATNLARFICDWPAESQHQKAALGLETLRAIGDASALQALVLISQRTRFAGLRARAEACVSEIAAELGLTPDELADTSVPACELDQAGVRRLDFGARVFIATIRFGGELRLSSESGTLLKALPKPGPADDEAKAAEAAKCWRTSKKAVADTVKHQRHRLERGLVAGRRWKSLSFERYLVAHPIMRSLACTLVWGKYDEENMLKNTFVIETAGTALVGPGGQTFTLHEDSNIGIAHPMQMDAHLLESWKTWFAIKAIEQTFPQLHRGTERVAAVDECCVFIPEFSSRMITAATLRRRMDTLGWRRGVPVDAGLFYEYALPFGSGEITAIVETSGQSVVTSYDDGETEVKRVFFVPGHYEPVEYATHPQALPLGLVDGVAYAETVRELRWIFRSVKSESTE